MTRLSSCDEYKHQLQAGVRKQRRQHVCMGKFAFATKLCYTIILPDLPTHLLSERFA